tara:strand:+ start:1811 stop:2374 length:564 start_codon:yes stop_codon:yes gene_type:complete
MNIRIVLEKKEKKEDFKPHKMYDPNSKDKVDANTKEDHEKYAEKGYIHIDPEEIRTIIGKEEGGAAGIKAFTAELPDFKKEEIEDALEKMDDIGHHYWGDYIMKDDETLKTKDQIIIKIIKEEIRLVLEKRKKRKKKKKKKTAKRDACYHKVKARYSVWPSAYASGALSKCRKVGAKNWGNKSKKKK